MAKTSGFEDTGIYASRAEVQVLQDRVRLLTQLVCVMDDRTGVLAESKSRQVHDLLRELRALRREDDNQPPSGSSTG